LVKTIVTYFIESHCWT